MNTKSLMTTAAACAVLSLTTSGAFAWGCARSFSGSGYRGSISHTSATTGGWGGYSHVGTTTATGRYGNTYTAAHASTGSYYGGAAYHGAAYGGTTVYHAGGYGGYPVGGCYGAGYGAAVATGAVIGAAAATAAAQPPPYPYNPYAPGVYYHPLL